MGRNGEYNVNALGTALYSG